MATSSDVINEALAWLRVIEIGETPAADETAAATSVLLELQGEWAARRVISIADLTNIDPKLVQPMAKALGNKLAPKFGRPFDPDIEMREESRLRELQTTFTRRRGVGAVQL